MAVVWGWGVAQFPYILEPQLTFRQAAAPATTLHAMLVSLGVGAAILVPPLVWLYVLFQRGRPQKDPTVRATGSG